MQALPASSIHFLSSASWLSRNPVLDRKEKLSFLPFLLPHPHSLFHLSQSGSLFPRPLWQRLFYLGLEKERFDCSRPEKLAHSRALDFFLRPSLSFAFAVRHLARFARRTQLPVGEVVQNGRVLFYTDSPVELAPIVYYSPLKIGFPLADRAPAEAAEGMMELPRGSDSELVGETD